MDDVWTWLFVIVIGAPVLGVILGFFAYGLMLLIPIVIEEWSYFKFQLRQAKHAYTGKDERQKELDKVLRIIDKHGEQLVHSIVDGIYPEIKAADVLASVREDVLALKGEQE